MQYDEWMSASDAIVWHIEREPLLRSAITTVWILDQPPDRARLAAGVQRAIAAVPRLTQRVEADPLGLAEPRWVSDASFDLDDHLDTQILDGDYSMRALLDLAARLHEEGIDKDLPPWEIHVVDGLADGRGALVVKVHHAIADGLGLVEMVGALVDFERYPDTDTPEAGALQASVPTDGTTATLSAALRHRTSDDLALAGGAARSMVASALGAVRRPLRSGVAFSRTAASVGHLLRPSNKPLSPVMTERSLQARFEVIETPLSRLRDAAAAASATVNDIYVAAVAAGLDRYHELHGAHPTSLRVTMPISIRGVEDSDLAGNRFVPVRFRLPIAVDDPAQRLDQIREHLRRERAQPALPLLSPISSVINRTGPAVTTALFRKLMVSVDAVISNVTGPPVPLYIAGSRIERFLPFGPCAGAALNITLLSYGERAELGINADRLAVPDSGELRDCIERGLDTVIEAAMAGAVPHDPRSS